MSKIDNDPFQTLPIRGDTCANVHRVNACFFLLSCFRARSRISSPSQTRIPATPPRSSFESRKCAGRARAVRHRLSPRRPGAVALLHGVVRRMLVHSPTCFLISQECAEHDAPLEIMPTQPGLLDESIPVQQPNACMFELINASLLFAQLFQPGRKSRDAGIKKGTCRRRPQRRGRAQTTKAHSWSSRTTTRRTDSLPPTSASRSFRSESRCEASASTRWEGRGTRLLHRSGERRRSPSTRRGWERQDWGGGRGGAACTAARGRRRDARGRRERGVRRRERKGRG